MISGFFIYQAFDHLFSFRCDAPFKFLFVNEHLRRSLPQSEAKGRTLVFFVILFNNLLNSKTLFLKSEKFQTTTKTKKELISYRKKSRDRRFANRDATRQDLS